MCVSRGNDISANGEMGIGVQNGAEVPSTSVQRGDNLAGFHDFYLKAKAKIWP